MDDLDYRFLREGDRPAVERLWEEETEWGVLTPELWARGYTDNPNGPATVVVASERVSGRVVGQFAYVASRVSVDGRIVQAYRAFAPILVKEFRKFRGSDPNQHPMFQMHRWASEQMQRRGDALIYTLPDPKWLRLASMLPDVRVGKVELWSLPLPLPEPFPADPNRCYSSFDASAEELDQLWAAASKLHVCMVVRDSLSMPWRAGADEGLVARRGSAVEGVARWRVEGRSKRQFLISDLLAADNAEALTSTLRMVCNLAHRRALSAGPDWTIAKISLLVPHVIEPVARELGFEPANYSYPLFVRILDPTIPPEEVAPERWYLTAND